MPHVEHGEETMYGLGLEFDMNEVLSNNIDGAWPVVREIDERLGG
ncbi:hypothetical protein BH11ACT4_BH11ACT4_06950 [soil metagenome]